MYGQNSDPIRVINNLQGDEKGVSVEEKRTGERKKRKRERELCGTLPFRYVEFNLSVTYLSNKNIYLLNSLNKVSAT